MWDLSPMLQQYGPKVLGWTGRIVLDKMLAPRTTLADDPVTRIWNNRIAGIDAKISRVDDDLKAARHVETPEPAPSIDAEYTILDRVTEPTPPPVATATREPSPHQGPGCTAADETLLVHSYLDKLASGFKGFGVLSIGHDRLEAAARGARDRGREDLAQEIEAVNRVLPDVHTPAHARIVADELERILPDTWELGRTCKLTQITGLGAKANELGDDVLAGRKTKDQAMQELAQWVEQGGR